MSYKDYYSVLGVPRDAPLRGIRKAYRRLVHRYHPDVSEERDAAARFKELGEAYAVLRDEQKRRLYDKWGACWKAMSEGRRPPGAPHRSEARQDFAPFGVGPHVNDLRSLFDHVFAGTVRRGLGAEKARPQGGGRRSSPVARTLDLPVSAAFHGGRRHIQIVDPETGRAQRLSVHLPGGVHHRQRIRLAAGGGTDLLLEVRIVSDERFRVDGRDLHTTLRISPAEAALGATATLVTLEGEVRVRVPPGSSTGRRVRLRERGYPGEDGRRGDLYAEIRIVVPPKLSEQERKLYRRLARVSRFDPRS